MELWVRSQDKNILEKVNKLYVATCEEENGFGIYDIRYDDLDDCDVPLGFYKTKERALEVLDEIHNRIATLTAIDLMGVNDTNLKVFNKYLKENPCSVVYEMPKD